MWVSEYPNVTRVTFSPSRGAPSPTIARHTLPAEPRNACLSHGHPYHALMIRCLLSLFTLTTALAPAAGDLMAQSADLILVNARILTVDPDRPEAVALAVRDGRFVHVGEEPAARSLAGPDTEVLDAGGRIVVPGFHDCHCHPRPIYPELSPCGRVALGPAAAPDLEALIERLRAKAIVTPPGGWVRGAGYQDTKLGRHPTREDLDRVSTGHFVYVSHSSGHVAAVNSYALEMAGIDADTPDPAGGAFDRDAEGRPTGVLRESAKSVVRRAAPPSPEPTADEELEGWIRCFEAFAAKGITSVTVAGASLRTLEDYRRAQAARPLVRATLMIRERYLDELEAHLGEHGRGDDWLRIQGVKFFHGNSLSGQTCWLHEPYHGRPGYFGIAPGRTQEELDALVWQVHRRGLQCCIHANGDREIDMVLDALQRALERRPRADHRHRIEHCSVVNARIMGRIRELGVAVAPHSYVYEHGDKMEAYGPARWPWMHPNRSCVELGVPVGGNSDWPVSAAHPMLRIQSMVTRRTAEGRCYGTQQRVDFAEALRIWTLGSAQLSFQESEKGSIVPGKLADFVILDTDPRTTPPDRLGAIEVVSTWVAGRATWRR